MVLAKRASIAWEFWYLANSSGECLLEMLAQTDGIRVAGERRDGRFEFRHPASSPIFGKEKRKGTLLSNTEWKTAV